MSRRTRALVVGGAIVMAQVALTAGPAPAVSGVATVTSIQPGGGLGGGLVSVLGTGCITPNGPLNGLQLLVRGPGASTNVVGSAGSLADATGAFSGLVFLHSVTAIGTYRASAICLEPGQPPGPESPGVPFMVTVIGVLPPALSGPGGPIPGTASTGTPGVITASGTTGTTAGTTGTTAASTGRAAPVSAQPRFTG